jgi:L-threonylcarbamoyladenylate synthase
MLVISQNDDRAINLAKKYLLAGKVIAIPTDTVYGLAVDASNVDAVNKLFMVKKRDLTKPIAIFLKDKLQVKKLFSDNKLIDKLVDKFLPGKLTIVAKTKSNLEILLAPNLNPNHQQYLGFRIVDSFFINKLFKELDIVLAVSSANISKEEVFKSAEEIAKSSIEVDLVISGEILDNLASTVVKIEEDQLKIIRQGAIKIYDL